MAKTTKTTKEKAATTKTAKAAKGSKEGGPKRPKNAYMFWLGENRAQFATPGLSLGEVGKAAGKAWQELADKTKWEKMAKADKERWEREKENMGQ